MEISFEAPVVEWRGPAPFHFVVVPEDESGAIGAVVQAVTYGWGMVPVEVRLGATTWRTALWPKDGGYVVPLKDAVRAAEGVGLGDLVRLELSIDV